MNYSVICKDKDDMCNKLNKYVKIELLDEIDNSEKRKKFQSICEYIQVNYNFSYFDNNNLITLDKFKFCNLYYICDNANIIDNTIYLPLIDINKYNWFLEQFEKISYNKNTRDLNLNFKIEYDDKIINEYNKKRLGKYRISITDYKN